MNSPTVFTKIVLLALSLLLLFSCGDDSPDFSEEQQIELFIQENGLQFESTSSGLRYSIVAEGLGDLPQPDDKMEVFIRGFSLDNAIFTDNFGGVPFIIDPFTDETSPRGLIEGLKLVGNKGQIILIMPSSIGFGTSGNANGVVQPDSPVGFVVEIGCLDNSEKSLDSNNERIESYLTANSLTAQKTDSGLYYIIEVEGDGENPSSTSTVDVHYRGYLLDGSEFDSSLDSANPANFALNSVIQGWKEGIPLFSRGGKGKLFIPHNLGYGCYPPSELIPPLDVLVFDIELIDF